MPRALAISGTTAFLAILHSYVSAQAPPCVPGYEWTYNSLHQTPCTMAVALGGACVNGGFSLDPLGADYVYLGPTTLSANSCRCSTVFYSLLSACAYCQGQDYLDWSIYDVNCSSGVYMQVFKEPIPSAIVVPHYAYLDVVAKNRFDVVAAENAGGPESTPVPQPTSTIPTITSVSDPGKKLNVGALVGGLIGGLAVCGIFAGVFVYTIVRCRKPPVSTPSTYTAYGSPQTMMSDAKRTPTLLTMTSGKTTYEPYVPTSPSSPVGYSASGSPQQVTSTITRNSTGMGASVPVRANYIGTPELA